jgi:hypothetical protein
MAAGLGYKEFSTGDVLTAADANGYLASQVVMVFASAAARTSAIASPQEGMISYLKDTNSTEYYSGSAWASIGGAGTSALTLVHNETLSGVSSVNIDSKFTSTYANYLVLANIEQSTANVMTVQYRSAGSSITSGYKSTYWYTEYTSNTWNVTSSASASNIWSVSTSTDRALLSMIIGDPQLSEFTKAQVVSTDNTYNLGYYSVYPQTTAIDGLRFSTSTGSMTGNIRIYGYQNS